MNRKASLRRKTTEVDVHVEININGTGIYKINTSIPFFDHMLEQFSKHGYFDLIVEAKGDIKIDFHHTVEDVGLTLGEAFANALSDKRGIKRFGEAFVPFDDALVLSVVDLSGRPFCTFKVDNPKSKIGEFDVELAEEFFKSFTNSLKCNLYIEKMSGSNLHHIVEAIFKAVARALDIATSTDPRSDNIPSTKGKL
jgi:imidazoleglycerol-phosphate dehydratase